MEKGTNEFYAQAAEKTVNERAARTFRDLCEWESRHMDYIRFLYQALQGDTDMLSFEEFGKRVQAPRVEGDIPRECLAQKLEERYTFINDTGAMVLALEIEGKAYNLYRRLAEAVTDSNLKVFLNEMMEQELKHIDYLKKMKAGLAETS